MTFRNNLSKKPTCLSLTLTSASVSGAASATIASSTATISSSTTCSGNSDGSNTDSLSECGGFVVQRILYVSTLTCMLKVLSTQIFYAIQQRSYNLTRAKNFVEIIQFLMNISHPFGTSASALLPDVVNYSIDCCVSAQSRTYNTYMIVALMPILFVFHKLMRHHLSM